METRQAKRRSSSFINLVLSVVLFLIALALTGMFSWISAGFRDDPLRDPSFWFSLSISLIINLFSFMSAITYDLPEQLEKNPQIIERESALLDFNLSIDPNRLEQFVVEINYERKKSVYLTKIERKIAKFIKKYKPSLADRRIWQKGTDEEKANNEYCVLLNELHYLKSEDYMKENLLYMEIKYPEVTSGMIISQSMSREGKLGYIYKNSQKATWWISKTLPRYAATTSLSIAWATFFITTTISIGPTFWIDFAVRLVGMLLNVMFGFYLTRAYVKNIVLGDLDFRLSLARQFVIWQNKQKNEVVKPVQNANA
jgi:hypothetical protein